MKSLLKRGVKRFYKVNEGFIKGVRKRGGEEVRVVESEPDDE